MQGFGGIEVRRTLDKGLGVFATTDMAKGTRIIVEMPLLVRGDTLEDLGSQFNPMSPEMRHRFNTLQYIPTPGNSRELSRFDSNSCGCPDFPPFSADVLFDQTARINHSCIPNAIQFGNPVLQMNTVQLVWAVKKDDEITICYIKPSMAYEARQSVLWRRWGFRCTCEICQIPGSHDWERERIGVLRRCLLLGQSPKGEEHLEPMAMAMEYATSLSILFLYSDKFGSF
jgi:SET domain-containing protein